MGVRWILFVICFLGSTGWLWSNNVSITNVQLLDSVTLQCEVAWENSWSLDAQTAPGNHDAVWLFVKVSSDGGAFNHRDLSSFSMDHQTGDPSLLMVDAVSDEKGVFVRRSAHGTGNIPATAVTLRLSHPIWPGTHHIRVFGIEMVHIPEGPFWLGDSISINSFRAGDHPGPFEITSGGPMTVGTGAGELGTYGQYPPEANIPAAYPNGFDGFYLMKYEVSQAQYRDFLNSLTADQQATRAGDGAITDPTGTLTMVLNQGQAHRSGITMAQPSVMPGEPAVYGCDANGDLVMNQNDDGGDRACNFLIWNDLAAYLDWAALRPFTEMEFEKAARGPNMPVSGEFAWGTPMVTDANTVQDDGLPTESVSEQPVTGAGLASHGYAGPQGPIRSGFAANATTNRLEAGASYYGVMELSGNLWEICVNVQIQGLDFDGQPGDGQLDISGDHDEPNWPSGNAAFGVGFQGGAWLSGIDVPGSYRDLAISDRYYSGFGTNWRRQTAGGRGAR